MRRSKAEVYLHLVWATQNRQPWLTTELTPLVYRCVVNITERLGGQVFAIGGMPDHVHLVVKLPPKTAISLLAQQVKGASSKFAVDMTHIEAQFRWQEGYGVFSVSRSHLSRVISYVENQSSRHNSNKVWAEWEETSEEALVPE